QRRRVPDVERIAEHARLHAELPEPPGDRLGLVRSVLGISAAGEDDHVGCANRHRHGPLLPRGAGLTRAAGQCLEIGGEFCRRLAYDPGAPLAARWSGSPATTGAAAPAGRPMLAASTEPIRMSGKPMPIPAVNCSL